MPDRTYRLAGGYLLDWDLFQRLRERAERRGGSAEDLRQALGLVPVAPLLEAPGRVHAMEQQLRELAGDDSLLGSASSRR